MCGLNNSLWTNILFKTAYCGLFNKLGLSYVLMQHGHSNIILEFTTEAFFWGGGNGLAIHIVLFSFPLSLHGWATRLMDAATLRCCTHLSAFSRIYFWSQYCTISLIPNSSVLSDPCGKTQSWFKSALCSLLLNSDLLMESCTVFQCWRMPA